MARATRSATQQESDKPIGSPPPTHKTSSKKRKRNSVAENGDQPMVKQLRVDSEVKEEDNQEPDDSHPDEAQVVDLLPSSGDVPIQSSDAEKILDILEMADTQGLLDRVFPLPADPSDSEPSTSSSSPVNSTRTYSFRTLLKDSSQYPLRVLRSAIHHLFPISSHPRSRPSAPAAQQLRFCHLALSLLDQASFRSAPIPLNVESLLSSSNAIDVDVNDTDFKCPPPATMPSPTRRRKYALLQQLPTGSFWSSLNSDFSSPSVDGKQLKDLGMGHAELVAILPSASTSASTSRPTPTLGSYVSEKPSVPQKMPRPRYLSCGNFLDYGPFASFAPSFEQEGAEIGRVALGETIWAQQRMRQVRELKGKWKALTPPEDTTEMQGIVDGQTSTDEQQPDLDIEDTFDGLLSADQIAAIKSTLGSLELEASLQELLERNSRALVRLEELQLLRLGSDSKAVEVGSEEWDLAQGIIDSLTLLASLRPRSSGDPSTIPLIPPPSVLRKLQRTLPLDSSPGWYGTLPDGRTTALRDDTTLRVKSGVTVTPAVPTKATVPVTAPTKPATMPAPAYTPYNYANYTGQYRGGYGTYTPGQGGAYYPNYPQPAQSQSSGTHYPNQQYNTSGQQQQYQYSSWYNYANTNAPNQPAANNAGSTSGQSSSQPTPQPATPSSIASNYASFFASTQQPQPQRAVANTVLSTAKAYAANNNTWAGGTSPTYAPPTLPSHLRTASMTPGSQPSTPMNGHATPNYYGNYSATPSTAR